MSGLLRSRIVSARRLSRTAVWLLVAQICRAASLVIDRRLWSARHGYALRRAERWDGAVAAYMRALDAQPGEDVGPFTERITSHPAKGSRPTWYYHLGVCLRRRGRVDAARRLLRFACTAPEADAGWFSALARAEEDAGDTAAAIRAAERAVELSHPTDARSRFRLASLLDQAGMWRQAAAVLEENLALHPSHTPSLPLLGEVALTTASWQGSLHGTVPETSAARFTPLGDTERAAVIERAVEALGKAVALAPDRPTWRANYAEALTMRGDVDRAIRELTTVLRSAERSPGRWGFGAKHRLQFRLEYCHRLRGAQRVDDPLFACVIEPVTGDAAPADTPVAGLFQVRPTHVGLVVSGMVTTPGVDHVDILFDGSLLRAVNTSRDGYLSRFSLSLKRGTVEMLPREGTLEVRLPDGTALLAPGGATALRLTVPHGDGRLPKVLADGGKLDKKGMISPTLEETRLRQDRYLETYEQVRRFFEEELGRPVFLMYGTLLGLYRDGDFIPGDDDFDAGYVSDRTDPVSVKEETMDIIARLVRGGFTVSFNRRGRLFRVELGSQLAGEHLDLRPLWFQDGKLWVHNHVCMPGSRDDFLPVVERKLRGVTVSIPRRTEWFLREHYGPGWKVPDPGFTYYASEVDPAVRENLNRALITVPEYRRLADRIRRETRGVPGAGRFVSVGMEDLYPLSGTER